MVLKIPHRYELSVYKKYLKNNKKNTLVFTV